MAREAFYANCSREDGEFISECDENHVVESVLAGYEKRLTEFFSPKEEDWGDDDDDVEPLCCCHKTKYPANQIYLYRAD